MLHVARVRHVREYVLRVEFDNGVTKDVDLRDELYGEMFAPLRDPDLFGRVRVNPETRSIEWPNGADFAPEFLYEQGNGGGARCVTGLQRSFPNKFGNETTQIQGNESVRQRRSYAQSARTVNRVKDGSTDTRPHGPEWEVALRWSAAFRRRRVLTR